MSLPTDTAGPSTRFLLRALCTTVASTTGPTRNTLLEGRLNRSLAQMLEKVFRNWDRRSASFGCACMTLACYFLPASRPKATTHGYCSTGSSLALLHPCQLFAFVCQLSPPCLTACLPAIPALLCQHFSRTMCPLPVLPAGVVRSSQDGCVASLYSEGRCSRDETRPDLCLSFPVGVVGYMVRSQFFSD